MKKMNDDKKKYYKDMGIAIVLAIICIIIGVKAMPENAVEDYVSEVNSEVAEAMSEAGIETDEATITYHFRNDDLLSQHFEKHGGEFSYATKEEYEAGASAVISNPNSLHKTEAEDGDGVYYLEETNEFVILSTDGYIRTYFKPSAGIDYYNRQ